MVLLDIETMRNLMSPAETVRDPACFMSKSCETQRNSEKPGETGGPEGPSPDIFYIYNTNTLQNSSSQSRPILTPQEKAHENTKNDIGATFCSPTPTIKYKKKTLQIPSDTYMLMYFLASITGDCVKKLPRSQHLLQELQ